MTRLRETIEALRSRSDVGVVDLDDVWRIIITKGRDLLCQVEVPHNTLEWHACVKHRGEKKELWADWMDYEGYDSRPTEELEAEMAADILAFVDRASAKEPLLPLTIYEERAHPGARPNASEPPPSSGTPTQA